ncbi:pilus assembly protein TadG-related protein [Novosphingobium sp. MMS21-SN21R]|uniref:TadE/TadG family type IV pilus assembly protein n=1 Tax=Novosphingobium sp. MMS21-SN21R TaxID=2969298 RepID=UPI002884DDB6|nr:pilus assembly protein TadG-related protein [Novosphingobium sp. MMS21-SN21R]MDT0508607.1 pilus assembly protein TadG-related protein [Novosphingobium sp. MMS21-SN21R]
MPRFLSRLRRSRAGSVLPLAAASVPVIVALIGGGLDMSRTYKARNRLQSACDAGTLAGRRAVTTNGYDQTARTQATTFFNTNFNQTDVGASGTTFATSSPDSGNLVNGTASTAVETVVMGLIGVETIDVSVDCSATMGVGNSDITMVLDTTGSMGWELSGTSTTRIDALRAAMKNFYTTVSAATQGSNARVRYSFVPYSSSVNVGRLINNLDPDYLVDEWPIQSRTPVYNTVNENVFVGWGNPVNSSQEDYSTPTNGTDTVYSNSSYKKKGDCEDDLPANGSWVNDGDPYRNPPSTTINGNGQQVVTVKIDYPQKRNTYVCLKDDKKYYIYTRTQSRKYSVYTYETSDPVYETRSRQVFSHFAYKQVTYDVSSYKNFQAASVPNGTDGATISYTWKGCIEERETESDSAFSYTKLTGMSPSTALDLDIDSAPESGDDTTRWAPMWPEVAYYRTQRVNDRTSLTNVSETLRGDKADSYCPYQAQLLQTMSQSAFYTYADSLRAEGSTYHDLGMIWGLRLNSPDGPWADTVNIAPSNGGKVSRHIIFMTDGELAPSNTIQSTYGIEWHDRRITDDGSSSQSNRHSARFRVLCDVAKAKGFRVWVIAFASGMTTDLGYCASDNSSYTATNAAQLNTAFQEIAKNVGELRVYQ